MRPDIGEDEIPPQGAVTNRDVLCNATARMCLAGLRRVDPDEIRLTAVESFGGGGDSMGKVGEPALSARMPNVYPCEPSWPAVTERSRHTRT